MPGQTPAQTADSVAVNQKAPEKTELPEEIDAYASGDFIGIEKVNDPTFAQKILGDGCGDCSK